MMSWNRTRTIISKGHTSTAQTAGAYAINATTRGIGQGVNSMISGGEFKDGFVIGSTLSVFSDGAMHMRADQVESSLKNPANSSASSDLFPDGEKLAGGRQVVGDGDSPSWTGGIQGQPNDYPQGNIGEFVAEYFAGPHDYLTDKLTDGYSPNGIS